MEKIFKIGSSRKYSEGFSFHKHTTAKVVWEYVILNGEEFIAGAVFTEGDYLAASMCAPVGSELEFCQALLRKAYSIPKKRQERGCGPYEKKNIYGRVVPRVTNPRQWVWDPQKKDLKFEMRPSRLMTEFRRR